MYRKFSLPGFIIHACPEPDEKQRILCAMKNISADTLVCQGCGKSGCMVPHGTYRRGITYIMNGNPVDDYVMIPVFYCPNCHYHHAFLTDFLIPFSSYTLLFILEVLKTCLKSADMTIQQICAKYHISPRTLYTWKRRFLDHYDELAASMGLPASRHPSSDTGISYKDTRSSLCCTMEHFLSLLSPDDITLTFFKNFGFSFLQGSSKKHLRLLPRPG